jgi:small GTP-binding protein
MDRKQTLGVECFDKIKYFDEKKIQIKIWDTAGQEKYAVMAKNYYQRAHGIILAFALNERSSFNNLKNWLKAIEDATFQEIPLIIIANKKDLVDQRQISEEEIVDKANYLKIEYFETSAKENILIDEAFEKIIEKVFNNIYIKKSNNITIDRDSQLKNEGDWCNC